MVTMTTALVVLLLVYCCVCAADINCDSVRYTYQGKAFTAGHVPKDPLTGEHLRICTQASESQSQALTCCTQEMERQLSSHSREEYVRAVTQCLNSPAAMLAARAHRFDEYFRQLLATSQRDFHDMFRRTYGVIYEQHAYVFSQLFSQLQRYYVRGHVDLDDVMDAFFSGLYQKMFTVLNAQYHFDDTYLRCVTEHMPALLPFGDVPAKLSLQLRRVLVATRVFSKALYGAAEVVSAMLMIPASPECLRALTKMTGCPACTGLPDLKACNNYCINVMKGCLVHHTELNAEWNAFLDALDKLMDRLQGPFNIELVVPPINIKISEAIMNFQENGQDVSHKIFQGCGKPQLGRRRRGAAELDMDRQEYADSTDGEDTSLEMLIKDIRAKVNDTRNLWANLPYQICNDDQVAASPAKDDSCWNGERKARYEQQIAQDTANPEVAVDGSRESSLLNSQVFTLRTLTSKLRSAYVGRDVDWMDAEDSSYGSGSGSGDGGGETGVDVEGSGDGGGPRVPGGAGGGGGSGGYQPGYSPDGNGMDNDVDPGHGPDGTSSGSATRLSSRMSVARALTTYLLPIVVVWFGGIFSDWL